LISVFKKLSAYLLLFFSKTKYKKILICKNASPANRPANQPFNKLPPGRKNKSTQENIFTHEKFFLDILKMFSKC